MDLATAGDDRDSASTAASSANSACFGQTIICFGVTEVGGIGKNFVGGGPHTATTEFMTAARRGVW